MDVPGCKITTLTEEVAVAADKGRLSERRTLRDSNTIILLVTLQIGCSSD